MKYVACVLLLFGGLACIGMAVASFVVKVFIYGALFQGLFT